MADDTNIDEILNNIDALLKEDGADGDDAQTADPAPIAKELEDRGGHDAPAAGVSQPGGGSPSDDAKSTDAPVENKATEASAVEDESPDAIAPETPGAQTSAPTEQAEKDERKRIVLSEAMLVGDIESAEAENQADTETTAPDLDGLIEKINVEVNARLEHELPALVSAMVVEAVEAHCAAHQGTQLHHGQADEPSANDGQI